MSARRYAHALVRAFLLALVGAFVFVNATAHAEGLRPLAKVDAKAHVLTKLRSGNTLKVAADFKEGWAQWQLIDAFSKKVIETHVFDSAFIGRAKSVSVDVLESFDSKIDIVLIAMAPGYEVVLYGDSTGLKVGPSVGPISLMKTVVEQKFDFTRLAASRRITTVNRLKSGGVEAYASYVWDGSAFTLAKAKQP